MKRKTMPLWASFAAAVLLAGGITLLALSCQPNDMVDMLRLLKRTPLLIVLNALPVGLILLLAAFVCGNVFFGAAFTNILVCGFSLANRMKIQIRDEPVFPRDVLLLREMGNAMGTYKMEYPVAHLVAVAVVTLILIALGLLLKSQPCPMQRLRRWRGRGLGAAVSLVLLVLATLTVYASDTLYAAMPASEPYYLPGKFNETGFIYNFFHYFTTYNVEKPEGYSAKEAESWETGNQTGLGKNVNVIFVMNEAFSALNNDPVFLTGEDDPLENLNRLSSDPHAVVGRLVVPNFAGGTANTEFDVLTGMQTNALSASNTSSFRVVNRNLDSVLRVFADDGYTTGYIHPGQNWFYNRENVLTWFGAGFTTFVNEMENVRRKGDWVTDEYVLELVEKNFLAAQAQGELVMEMYTTIQNHMAYTAAKYGADYVFPTTEVDADVSEEIQEMLNVYTEGIRDADAMLGGLTTFFSQQDTPVLLVFWGDHLPFLGENRQGYEELGLEIADATESGENPVCGYETPYVLWVNDAAAEALQWEQALEALQLPEDGRISASFLGAAVVELTGRTGESPWFDFLNQVRRELPVVHNRHVYDFQGNYLETLNDEQEALITQWRRWSYYKLTAKRIES